MFPLLMPLPHPASATVRASRALMRKVFRIVIGKRPPFGFDLIRCSDL
jgi:hypothetical protein